MTKEWHNKWKRHEYYALNNTNLHSEVNWNHSRLPLRVGRPKGRPHILNVPPEANEHSDALQGPDYIPERGQNLLYQRNGSIILHLLLYIYTCSLFRYWRNICTLVFQDDELDFTLTWNATVNCLSGSWCKSFWSKNSSNSKTLLWKHWKPFVFYL